MTKSLIHFDPLLKKLCNQTDAILGVIQDGQKDKQKLSQIEMEMDKNNSDLAKLTGDLEQKIAKAKLFIPSTIKTQLNLVILRFLDPLNQFRAVCTEIL